MLRMVPLPIRYADGEDQSSPSPQAMGRGTA